MVNIKVNGATIKGIELIVFDKDGTLIDLYTYWANMIEMRAKEICSYYGLEEPMHKENLMYEMGVDVKKKKLRPEGPVGILPRRIVQKAAEDYLLKQGCDDVSSVCFGIFEKVDILSLNRLSDIVKPVPGAVGLLREIKENGSLTAIATTDRTERAELAVRILNIENLIDLVVGADKVAESKPEPEMLELIEKLLGVRPEHSVMVGDARTDVQMGINAGYKASIGVSSGLTEKETLEAITPYVIEDVSKMMIEKEGKL